MKRVNSILFLTLALISSNAFSIAREGVLFYKKNLTVDKIQLTSGKLLLSKYGNYIPTPLTYYYLPRDAYYRTMFEKKVISKKCVKDTFEMHVVANYGIQEYNNINRKFAYSLKAKGYKETWGSFFSKGYDLYTGKSDDVNSLLVKVTPTTYIMSVCKTKR